MPVINVVVCVSLLLAGFPLQAHSDRREESLFTVLAEDEMSRIVGGSSVGQIELNSPAHNVNVSGDGSIYYSISYRNVAGTADLVLFVANSSAEQTEIARLRNVTGDGGTTGYFSSYLVNADTGVLAAELVNPNGDPYDSCTDGTDTVYGRATIYVSGNGT